MKYLKILYRLLVYHTSFSVCFGDIKKSSENDQSTVNIFYKLIYRIFFRLRVGGGGGGAEKSSENDRSTGHFQSLFFRPPDP